MNSKRVINFCRFFRLNDDVGYNLDAGRGEGRYRYYGDGLAQHECGISIANPDENDKSPWKCWMGVDGKEIVGAIIDGSDPTQPYEQGIQQTHAIKFISFLCFIIIYVCIRITHKMKK